MKRATLSLLNNHQLCGNKFTAESYVCKNRSNNKRPRQCCEEAKSIEEDAKKMPVPVSYLKLSQADTFEDNIY